MLRSEASGRHYYGYTSDLKQRVHSHQSTQNKYTRGKGPWVLLGYARYDTKAEALRIERKLKAMKNPQKALNWLSKHGVVR